MGRGSFQTVQDFDPWPYTLPVLVLSSTLAQTTVPDRLRGKVEFADLSPRAAVQHMGARGHHRLYVDGGQIVQAFLREGLIDDLVLTRIPVLLGSGRPLFGALPADIALTHVSTRSFASGLVQSHYRVAQAAA